MKTELRKDMSWKKRQSCIGNWISYLISFTVSRSDSKSVYDGRPYNEKARNKNYILSTGFADPRDSNLNHKSCTMKDRLNVKFGEAN